VPDEKAKTKTFGFYKE